MRKLLLTWGAFFGFFMVGLAAGMLTAEHGSAKVTPRFHVEPGAEFMQCVAFKDHYACSVNGEEVDYAANGERIAPKTIFVPNEEPLYFNEPVPPRDPGCDEKPPTKFCAGKATIEELH